MSYRQNRQTAGRVIDGLAFIVTPKDNKLHTLNETGTVLWQLAKAGVDVEGAAQALSRDFEVDRETARRDAELCLEDLVAREILVRE